MKNLVLASAVAALSSGAAYADADTYSFDPTHSAIKFSWNHGGFSTTYGMFFEVDGSMMLDAEDPSAASVSASVPLSAMLVDPTLKGHLGSDRWFNGLDEKLVEFTSTSVELTGDETALVTGDLTINGMTAKVVLDASLNTMGEVRGNQVVGFDATTTILRSDFGVGAFAPFVSDEIAVEISIEASPAS
ncbi:MAG: YceI family protein [Rhodobacteraceae bacterium]|nr:YceI family protein [Paracoccaceae bacterium]